MAETDTPFESENPLRGIVAEWLKKIGLSREHKREQFSADADECMRFYNGAMDSLYDLGKLKKSSTGFRRSEEGQPFPAPTFQMQCLVAGTPVRMADGTEKPIETIVVGDEVISHTGKVRKVLNTFAHPYTGSLTTLTLRGFPFPITMTAEHKMAVWNGSKAIFTPSANISEDDAMLVGKGSQEAATSVALDIVEILGPDVIRLDDVMRERGSYAAVSQVAGNSVTRLRQKLRRGGIQWEGKVKLPRTGLRGALPESVRLGPDLARLLGLYLADGCVSTDGLAFSFGPLEEHYAREVAALILDIFGVPCRVRFRSSPGTKGIWQAVCSNKNLKTVFKSLCPGGARTKRVPAVLFGCDVETRLALLKGWMDGDGHTSCKETAEGHAVAMFGVTVSAGMARDMTVLALSCGLRAKTYLLKEYRGNSDRYTVFFSGEKAAFLLDLLAEAQAIGHEFKSVDHEFCELGAIRKVKKVAYREVVGEMVYDFEVECDHSYLANGVVSSNSNKVAECVQLFGPILYHDDPTRQVNPRKKPEIPAEIFQAMQPPPDPMMMLQGGDPAQQQMAAMQAEMLKMRMDAQDTVDLARAKLIEWYLNYTPRECNLKNESRMAIDEALIKGMGVVWTELVQPVDGGPRMATSTYDSVDNVDLDPDAERLEDCLWIARKRTRPYWQVEIDYKRPPGSLRNKSSVESYAAQGEGAADRDDDSNRRRGRTNDLMVYYEIYSKMGVGGRLANVDPKYRAVLDLFGNYAYLVVARDVPYPLNLPNDVLAGDPEVAMRALDWPTPYWLDRRWPMVPLFFHRVPRQLWPMCHFKPAMGELKALNWLYSMIISKIGITCRDFLVILKSATKDIKDAVKHGPDFTLIELAATHPGTIDQLVQFLQHPQMNGDVWKVLEAIKEEFEKRTGLSELLYGMSGRQMRSASEANLKADQINVRPEDMANKVEDWSGEVARNEALCARWNLEVKDVAPLMGDAPAQLWGQLVIQVDPYLIVRQLEYDIEAGSAKKPNKERDAANLQQAMNLIFQPLFVAAQQTGAWGPVNSLIGDWARANDLDGSKYLFPEMPPPPPPPPAGPPSPGGQGGAGGGASPVQVGAPPMPGPAPVQVGGF